MLRAYLWQKKGKFDIDSLHDDNVFVFTVESSIATFLSCNPEDVWMESSKNTGKSVQLVWGKLTSKIRMVKKEWKYFFI